MGCDIHMVLERKVGGKWVADLSVQKYLKQDRNYRRFAALAGVRGDGPPPRGLPDDISDSTRLLVDDCGNDFHSHSWLPIKEAAQIFLETDYEPSDYDRKYPEGSYFCFDKDEYNEAEVRLIFCFDN